MKAILVAALISIPACSADQTVKRAETAVEVNAYRVELLACKAAGKDAGSFAVYEECAQGVDAKHGLGKDAGHD